jgi:hypothetical protein
MPNEKIYSWDDAKTKHFSTVKIYNSSSFVLGVLLA